jgi:hypothetical protein
MQSLLSATIGRNVISTKRLGDLAEQWVCLLAAWKGAEVFPNINSTGATDLLMIIDGRTIQIDVKCDQIRHSTGRWVNTHSGCVSAPVYPVAVTPGGDICSWTVRWIQGREPSGLSDFWSKDYSLTSTTTAE